MKNNDTNVQQKVDDDVKVLSSAPPPWHSLALVGGLLSMCVYYFPSLESIDEIATIETITKSNFPQYINLKVLGYCRLIIAISVYIQIIHTAFISDGWIQTTNYLPNSKLKKVPFKFSGYKTQFQFTSCCWNMIGIYSTLSSAITLFVAYGHDPALIPQWILRITIIAWEIAAPLAPLVSSIIRYAIWPGVLKNNGDTSGLKHWRNMLAHNMNSIYCLVEMSLLGGLPIRLSEFVLPELFGLFYIIFSWNVTHIWTNDIKKNGPQFAYFFLDTTLPGYKPTIIIMILLTIFGSCFLLFFTASYLINNGASNDNYIIGHILYVVLISSVVVRIRD